MIQSKFLLLITVLFGTYLQAQPPRLVLVDQDGSGPGGSNQMALLVLLQAPNVKVLGITMVTGDAWEPAELQHTLRMLELTHHTDTPVVPGAIYPLLRTERQTILEQNLYGKQQWLGAWGDVAQHTGPEPSHTASIILPPTEGLPTLKPLGEDAAHFLIRQVHAHPHEVTIYAAGPLTNIALAQSIDPSFATQTAGIVIMGGSLNPMTQDPEFSTNPRHEFNFWFDPEAAHIVLTAPWPRIDLTTVDISLKAVFTESMLAEIARHSTATAQYIAKYSENRSFLWDELAAAAWLDPTLITAERQLYLDVDLTRGPTYGDTLAWTEANKPETLILQKVHAQTDLDLPRFTHLFTTLMSR